MDYHPVTAQITSLLASNGCWFETFEHPPVRTSEEAAKLRSGYELKQGAKAIILRVRYSKANKQFVMLVFPADRKFDENKVKALLRARDLRFATEQEVAALTGGVQVGGVPPFGNLFSLPVIVDPALLENERIVFNAGDRCFSVAMRSTDFIRLVNPRFESFTEEADHAKS